MLLSYPLKYLQDPCLLSNLCVTGRFGVTLLDNAGPLLWLARLDNIAYSLDASEKLAVIHCQSPLR